MIRTTSAIDRAAIETAAQETLHRLSVPAPKSIEVRLGQDWDGDEVIFLTLTYPTYAGIPTRRAGIEAEMQLRAAIEQTGEGRFVHIQFLSEKKAFSRVEAEALGWRSAEDVPFERR
jgi:hypothetical protein